MRLNCCGNCCKWAIFYLKSTTRTWSCQSSLLFVAHSTSLSPLQSCNYSMVNSFPEPIISCTVSVLFCSCYNRGAQLLSIYWYQDFWRRHWGTVLCLCHVYTKNENGNQWEHWEWKSPDRRWHIEQLTSAALIVENRIVERADVSGQLFTHGLWHKL